jgi:enamine deaminase RidA (YjgF/YER057c/UK114 family)
MWTIIIKEGDPMEKHRVQPPDMAASPAFSQAIEITAPSAMLFIGGQNAIDRDGKLLGDGDFLAQCRQSLQNVKTLLDYAWYSINDVLKMTIYYAKGNDARLGFRAYQEVFGIPTIPPAVTVIQVAEMAIPERLVEVEAVAAK